MAIYFNNIMIEHLFVVTVNCSPHFLPFDLAIIFLDIHPREMKHVHTKTYSHIYSKKKYNSKNMKMTQMSID